MDSQNPYQPPPHEYARVTSDAAELGYFPYAFIAFKLAGLALVGLLAWFASGRHPGHAGADAALFLWGLLVWTGIGTLAAIGVALRRSAAKNILVAHLLITAGVELYAFAAMMGLTVPAPLRNMALNFGWAYFLMALWDLGWAALFQFSASLRQALR